MTKLNLKYFEALEEESKPKLNGKIAYFLRLKDQELSRQRAWDRKNICPHCHVVLTTLGECANDCGYIKSRKRYYG